MVATGQRAGAGDQYQIGDAVFEITQPRVTCFRVGIQMNDPECPRCWSLITGPVSSSAC